MLGWEKRASRRVPINCPLQIMLPNGREFMGIAHDLSVDGIQFDCPVLLQTADKAEIKLQPPSGALIEPLHAAIEVIRCDPTASPHRFLVAAKMHAI